MEQPSKRNPSPFAGIPRPIRRLKKLHTRLPSSHAGGSGSKKPRDQQPALPVEPPAHSTELLSKCEYKTHPNTYPNLHRKRRPRAVSWLYSKHPRAQRRRAPVFGTVCSPRNKIAPTVQLCHRRNLHRCQEACPGFPPRHTSIQPLRGETESYGEIENRRARSGKDSAVSTNGVRGHEPDQRIMATRQGRSPWSACYDKPDQCECTTVAGPAKRLYGVLGGDHVPKARPTKKKKKKRHARML